MGNDSEAQKPNPVAFRLMWGLVVVVAIGSVWVVWDATMNRWASQAGIFDADAPEWVSAR